MKRLLAASLLLGAAPPADGQWSDATPPLQYQGNTQAILLTVHPTVMNAACGSNPPQGITVIACTRWLKDGMPVVIMPNPCAFDDETFAHVLCHEMAHVQSWGGDHPR